jgi:hypothetical protein
MGQGTKKQDKGSGAYPAAFFSSLAFYSLLSRHTLDQLTPSVCTNG